MRPVTRYWGIARIAEDPMLDLSSTETQAIVDFLHKDFASRVQRYDGYKYPEDAYDRLRIAFHTWELVTGDQIRDALVWKYGHWRKRDFPGTHKNIIVKIQHGWAPFVKSKLSAADQIFDYWTTALSDHQSFITVTFLVHLLVNGKVPIIDQHNFRAMNFFLQIQRPHWIGHKKPSKFNDVLDLREFMHSIQECWSSSDYPDPPNERSLDKYLMVLGQDLKKMSESPTASSGRE
jgi:hypothetical protein